MIWISFAKWSSKTTAMFHWKRVYRHGYLWTPFIMAFMRYPKISTDFTVTEIKNVEEE